MSYRAKAYIAAVIAAGALTLGYGGWNWESSDWRVYLFFLAISAVASGLKVTLLAGAGTMSLNFIFVLIGIEVLSLGETLGIACAGMLVQRLFSANNWPSPVQIVFNVSGVACATAIAYGAYHWLAAMERLESPVLLLTAAVTFFLANTFSVALVIALTERQAVWDTWRESYFWSFSNYLLGAAIAWVATSLGRSYGWQTSLLLLPVLYAVYRTHRMYVDRIEEEKGRAEAERAHAEQMASLHRRTIETLALAVEAKDQTTADHLARVEVYALAIGAELELSDLEMQALEAAALLHDIGKLAVPEYIISKPGKLTKAEFEKMKIHPVVGAELLEKVGFPYPVAPIVRAHHEKWDGSGYPYGLAGEQIPIGARILSTVDCMDALASDRQYRRALPLNEAIAFVQKEAGRSFDPQVVDILARRYVELERKAKSSLMVEKAKLSTDMKVTRGAAPDAGFQSDGSAGDGTTTSDLLSMNRSIAASGDRSEALKTLRDALESCTGPEEGFAIFKQQLQGVVAYELLVIYRVVDEILRAEWLEGEGAELFAALEIPIGAGLSGWVAENRKAIVNGNPSVEPGYLDDPTKFSTLGSALAIPVENDEEVIAVLAVYRRDRDAFQRNDLLSLQAFGRQVAAACLDRTGVSPA